MSSEDCGRRNTALRLAAGVTGCFVLADVLNWDATFLAPVLAAQLLLKLPKKPSLKHSLGVIVVIVVSMFGVLFLSTVLVSNALSFILFLALLHYLSFYAHLRGAPEFPTLMVQIAGVAVPVYVVVAPALASGLATTLVQAGVIAVVTVWVSFLVFPAPDGPEEMPAVAADKAGAGEAAALALLKTLILMPILTWFVLDASQTAIVALVMIITILRLADPRLGWRAAAGMIVANLLGGVAATVAYNIVRLGDSVIALTLVILCFALFFAGRIVTARENATIFAVGFVAFILLLGTGLSPLPGGAEAAAVSRVMNVVWATAYAAGALSLFQNLHIAQQRLSGNFRKA